MTTWKWMAVLAMGLLVAQVGCDTGGSSAQTPAKGPQAAPAAQPPAAATAPSPRSHTSLRSVKELRSYSLGVDTARNFQKLGLDVDLDILAQGMKDAAAGGKLLATDDMIRNAMAEMTGETRVKMAELRINAAAENKKAGDEFLAANKEKEGVVTLPSGLQYKILTAGNGPVPTKDDTVVVVYKGMHLDGTVFDSSAMTKKAALMQVSDGSIIAGFREALRLMPVGSSWRLFVPARLAYLERGRGTLIGPNETLIFDVELRAITTGIDAATQPAQ